MPDLLFVFAKRWKWIVAFTVSATLVALLFAFLSPRKYLSVATALPANSVTADKSRIFSSNIEALYSEFGTPDELDRIEGTARLDTVFIAVSKSLNLPDYYSIKGNESIYKAAICLKKYSRINRSSYGELKVKVWDGDKNKAAELANALMYELQALLRHLQNQSNALTLEKIKERYGAKQKEYLQLADSVNKSANAAFSPAATDIAKTRMAAIAQQLQGYERMAGEYELAVSSNSPVLLVVENARPALLPDKPKILATVLFSFFGALVCGYLVALFIESRNQLN